MFKPLLFLAPDLNKYKTRSLCSQLTWVKCSFQATKYCWDSGHFSSNNGWMFYVCISNVLFEYLLYTIHYPKYFFKILYVLLKAGLPVCYNCFLFQWEILVTKCLCNFLKVPEPAELYHKIDFWIIIFNRLSTVSTGVNCMDSWNYPVPLITNATWLSQK